jgi:hypothetical protein
MASKRIHLDSDSEESKPKRQDNKNISIKLNKVIEYYSLKEFNDTIDEILDFWFNEMKSQYKWILQDGSPLKLSIENVNQFFFIREDGGYIEKEFGQIRKMKLEKNTDYAFEIVTLYQTVQLVKSYPMEYKKADRYDYGYIKSAKSLFAILKWKPSAGKTNNNYQNGSKYIELQNGGSQLLNFDECRSVAFGEQLEQFNLSKATLETLNPTFLNLTSNRDEITRAGTIFHLMSLPHGLKPQKEFDIDNLALVSRNNTKTFSYQFLFDDEMGFEGLKQQHTMLKRRINVSEICCKSGREEANKYVRETSKNRNIAFDVHSTFCRDLGLSYECEDEEFNLAMVKMLKDDKILLEQVQADIAIVENFFNISQYFLAEIQINQIPLKNEGTKGQYVKWQMINCYQLGFRVDNGNAIVIDRSWSCIL